MTEKQYIPSEEEIAKTLDDLAKAWPVLAKHANHIDGLFNGAHTKAKRMFEALRQALVGAAGQAAYIAGEAWQAGYDLGCDHGATAARDDMARREAARRACTDNVEWAKRKVDGE